MSVNPAEIPVPRYKEQHLGIEPKKILLWVNRATKVAGALTIMGLLQSSTGAPPSPNEFFSIPTPQPIASEIYPQQPQSKVVIQAEGTPAPSSEPTKEPSIYDKLTPPASPWSEGQEKVQTVGTMIEQEMPDGRRNLKTYLKAFEWNDTAKKWELIEGSEHLIEQLQMTPEENAQFVEQANAQKAAIETLPAIYDGLDSPKVAPKEGEPQQVIVSKLVTYKDKDGRTVEVYPMIVYEWDVEIYGWRIINKSAMEVPQPLESEKQ